MTRTDIDATWSEPAVEKIELGVYRIPLPLPQDGLKAVNVYVLESDDGLTCIDGGWAIAEARKVFARALGEIGHHPRDITSFLVTHVHRDHYTQAAAIRSEFGQAVVSLGVGERRTLESARRGEGRRAFVNRLERAGADQLAHEWAESQSGDEQLGPQCWEDPDVWLHDDTTIEIGRRSLQAVRTPGHTAGHFVFADLDAGLLFAGDHVLPTITPSVGFEVGHGSEAPRLPLADYLESLARVRGMEDLRLLPAHGAANRRSHERIDELLEHHEKRLDLCLEAVAGGAQSAWDVAHALPWTRRETQFDDLDVFNTGLAVLETQLHLQLLAAQHRVRHWRDSDVDQFLPTIQGASQAVAVERSREDLEPVRPTYRPR